MLDALPTPVFVADSSGSATYHNACFQSYTGRAPEQLADDRWLEVIHPDDRARVDASWREALRTASLWEADCRLQGADGRFRWHMCRAEPHPDTGVERSAWFGTCVDIEQRKTEDAARAWLAAIVAASDDAIVSKTLDGTIRSWNFGAERIFGYSAAEAIGQSITLIIPPDRLDEERSILARLRRGQRIDHLETERVTRDGRRIAISLTVSPVKDDHGALIGASKVARDITERKRAAQALQDSEAKLTAIVEHLPIGVMVTDDSGRILSLNTAGRQIHGLDPATEILVPLDVYRASYHLRSVDGSVLPLEQWPVSRAARGEYLSDAEVLLCRPDRERRAIVFSTVPIRGTSDNGLLLFVMQDVTNRRRTEQELAASRAQLRLVTDHAAVMLTHCDTEGRYLFVNRTYIERFGLQADQVIGRRIGDVIGADAYAVIEPFVRRVLQGELVEFETQLPYSTLGQRFMHCVYVPDFDEESGRVRSFVAAITDVTQRKQLENELVEADRRKDEFLAVLGHELRNPLAPLSTGLELLKHAVADPEAIGHVRQVMQRQLVHLVRLVDDLVNVSRISRGLIEIERRVVDMRQVVSNGIELARPLIDQRGHRLVAEAQGQSQLVEGDPERLTQVVANLLTNAAKYTKPDGYIRISTQVENDRVVLRVRDNGLGIPEDRLHDIFEMFSQLPEHREHVSGSGLGIGLALSRQLIELHGGSIEARSPGPGHGSEFLVSLPLATAAAQSPVEQPPVTAAGHRRVLVVDDNVDAANSIQMLLRVGGHDVRVAYDGAAALSVLDSFPADVILLDIGLPKLDGYEVARRVRTMPGGEKVLLVALTGWGQAEARHRTEQAGFDEHLTKPVDPALLAKLLQS